MHASLLGKSQGGSCRTVQHTSRHQSSSHRKLSKMAAAAGWEQPADLTSAPSAECLKALKAADAVAFDVDSTFCEDESIDELAAYMGVGEQVAAMTARAMGGTMDFKSALSLRLDVMKPSQATIQEFLAAHPHRLSKGIPQLLEVLKSQGKSVFLVSGGFRNIIHPLAHSLQIPEENVFANNILFDESGAYKGFDENEFTCRSGGKPAALKHIKEKFGCRSVIMVGDGATDLEARLEGVASLFVGYGGVVARPNIAAKADWYIMDIQQLIDAFKA
mmetsp:Transcript_21056/g.58496  ORF Transcript_21056/g.58496 Transcript_21056/m.58496 type:complete len:275 (-) Transcript_21056:455-1279(-)